MKAIVTLNNNEFFDESFDCEVSKDGNVLVLYFKNDIIVPWSMIKQCKFTVELKPTEEKIGCSGDCNTCMTPIC